MSDAEELVTFVKWLREGAMTDLMRKKAVQLIERQAEENAALRKDAERYRWLRNPPPGAHEHLAVCTQDEALFEESLDTAIDAAMKEKP